MKKVTEWLTATLNKLLSRKVIASTVVFITALVYIWNGRIDPVTWVKVSVACFLGYAAGEALDGAVRWIKNGKGNTPAVRLLSEDKAMTYASRIANLFTSSFVAAIVLYMAGTVLFWYSKIGVNEWMYLAMGMSVGYDILNPLEKLG